MATINGTNINGEFLTGTADDDVITGLAGADRIEGLAGADQIDGGDGTDTAVYRNSGAGVQVNLTTGFGTGGDAQGDVLIRFENIDGSNFNDTLTGDAGANWLAGGFGSDVIEGGGGADLLDGGSFGGSDTVSYAGSSADVTVDLIATTGAGGDAEGDEVYNFQNIIGSAHNDVLNGDNTGNILTGGDGNDTLTGRGGSNTLIGGSGDDTAVFAGNRADATITNTGGIYTVVTAGGTHTVQGVEFLRFDDETVTIDATLPAKDINAPTISVAGVFETDENRLANAAIGTVAADDSAVGGTGTPGIAKFEIIKGNESGFFAIDNVGNITLTTLGAATTSAANDFEVDPNTFRLSVVATDLDDNKSNTLEVVISVKDDPNDADIRVTTVADVVDANDGVISLREAITLANNAPTGEQSVIAFGSGTYALSSSTIQISSNVVLRGTTEGQTTIGSGGDLITTLGSTVGIEGITFDNVKLTNTGGVVTIRDSAFNNHVQNPELVYINSNWGFGLIASSSWNKYAPSPGGAISNYSGNIEIVDSSFKDNHAVRGGAIAASGGYVSIDATSFDSNGVNIGFTSSVIDIIYKYIGTHIRSYDYVAGEGAAIYATGSAQVDVYSNKTGNGTPTTLVNNTIDDTIAIYIYKPSVVATEMAAHRDALLGDIDITGTNSLVTGQVYLDPAIVVTSVGNEVELLTGVTRTTPFAGDALSSNRMASNVSLLSSSGSTNAVLNLVQGLDLSLNNHGWWLVENAILSQSATEIVLQMAGHRVVFNGDGLAFTGDMLVLMTGSTPDAAIAAASGTVTSMTFQNVDGTQTLGILSGVSSSFASVIAGYTTPMANGNMGQLGDIFGVTLEQNGSNEADVLMGSEKADVIIGNGGNDDIVGQIENDSIDGGDGIDTAHFVGARSQYVVFTASDGKTIVLDNVGARDGKDSILNVENFTFGTETVTLANALAEPADADNSAFQVYRFYNTQTGSHFFTTSLAERNSVIENLDPLSFEGNSFDSNATEATGTAVFRFFNFANSAHFYTANAGEAAGLRQDSNFRDEGLSYYASDDASNGGTELFRFFNTLNGTHFYTVSSTERDNIISTLGHYNYEGTAFYVDVA